MGVISPMFVGDTLPVISATIVDDSGTAVSLSGATLTLRIYNAQTGVNQTGAGTWTITNAAEGQASYAWDATDTAVAATYELFTVVVFASGGQQTFGPVPWEVQPS